MLDVTPSAIKGGCAAMWILTMQMRHLYRSPRCICLSSSLIRAFRASMVVAVDSSSVTLVRRGTVSDIAVRVSHLDTDLTHLSQDFSEAKYAIAIFLQTPSMFSHLSLKVYSILCFQMSIPPFTTPCAAAPKQPLINVQHDNGKCAFNTVRQHIQQR